MPGKPKGGNGRIAIGLVAVAAGMVGLAYASVPLYRVFCSVTGYGGTTQVAAAAPDHAIDRDIFIRFDANISGLPWSFRPAVPQVKVKVGETANIEFIATNHSDRETVGTAVFNVTPDAAGLYFNKIACFCFNQQELKPGETARMGVQFFVSPDMVKDAEMKSVRAITLSYTFFPAEVTARPVADADTANGSNKPL
ncbi:cytochrome c oxidase assembly protein [Propylenella binzhouense]|uniref:Cytochrome c oxidase assembly protein CtaG n=1 Tax=Propylenella binzhouense TaxID=2555902 RepID=A0A964T4V4_9HYPH|nr:cytochrome c oxidase assembly protein [Propylenella binzhouense]MYZ48548.1 cytochrome c oxidase assembly protein [Propylenella binzhouense]